MSPGIIAGSKQLLALNCESPDSTAAFVQSSPKPACLSVCSSSRFPERPQP